MFSGILFYCLCLVMWLFAYHSSLILSKLQITLKIISLQTVYKFLIVIALQSPSTMFFILSFLSTLRSDNIFIKSKRFDLFFTINAKKTGAPQKSHPNCQTDKNPLIIICMLISYHVTNSIKISSCTFLLSNLSTF